MVLKGDVTIRTPQKRVWDVSAGPNQIRQSTRGKCEADFHPVNN